MNSGNDVTTLLHMEKILKTEQLMNSKYSIAGQSHSSFSTRNVKIIKGHLLQNQNLDIFFQKMF